MDASDSGSTSKSQWARIEIFIFFVKKKETLIGFFFCFQNSNFSMYVGANSLINALLPILDRIGKTCSGTFRSTTDLIAQSQGYAYGFTAYRIHENVIRVMANKVYEGVVELYDYIINEGTWNYVGSLISKTDK